MAVILDERGEMSALSGGNGIIVIRLSQDSALRFGKSKQPFSEPQHLILNCLGRTGRQATRNQVFAILGALWAEAARRRRAAP